MRAGSRVLIGARVRVGGEFASPGRQCTAGRGPNRTAGEVAALAGRRGVVAASLGVQDACAHGEKPRGRTGGTVGLSRVHLAADEVHRRRTGARRRSREGKGSRDYFVNSKRSRASL